MIVVRSPFRLPLGGGGTDLPSYYSKYGGSLVTAAINKYMFININVPAVSNKFKINYSKVEILNLDEVDNIQHEIVRESLKYLNIKGPIEISSMADLSAGTGMGSSSSYTVGLLKGLNTLLRRFISVQELAEEACKIEIELIGKPIGKQDQYAAAFGGIIQMDIEKSGYVHVTPINLDHEIIVELESRLMMFYTNIERDANVILAEQSKKISNDKEESSNGPEEGRKEKSAVEIMHRIKEIGYHVKESLVKGDIDNFGKLLHEHWLEKKSVSDKMSNSDIDNWYNLALQNGALGGKVMGAGGGGFLLFCVKNGNRKKLRQAMQNAGLKYMDFKFDFEGAKLMANI